MWSIPCLSPYALSSAFYPAGSAYGSMHGSIHWYLQYSSATSSSGTAICNAHGALCSSYIPVGNKKSCACISRLQIFWMVSSAFEWYAWQVTAAEAGDSVYWVLPMAIAMVYIWQFFDSGNCSEIIFFSVREISGYTRKLFLVTSRTDRKGRTFLPVDVTVNNELTVRLECCKIRKLARRRGRKADSGVSVMCGLGI